jgi:GTPase involved in cell partitioning and DNA repair
MRHQGLGRGRRPRLHRVPPREVRALGRPQRRRRGPRGDVVLLGDDDTNNLVDFKFKPHWKGERGEHGLGKDCNGREGRMPS